MLLPSHFSIHKIGYPSVKCCAFSNQCLCETKHVPWDRLTLINEASAFFNRLYACNRSVHILTSFHTDTVMYSS